LLYLLRWFWWRISAATELAAMLASFSIALILPMVDTGLGAWQQLVIGVALTTGCWLPFAYLGPPSDEATLVDFYRKIRPAGPGWKRVARMAGADVSADRSGGLIVPLLASLLGSTGIYALLFTTGFMLYGEIARAAMAAAVAGLSGFGLARIWRRNGRWL